MEMIDLSLQGPARLYALFLRLRPLQPGTLMPFSGELVHGAFLSWLRQAAPEVVAWLHEGQKRRFFTCSSLRFTDSAQRLLQAERENIHLPLKPEQTYVIRLTLLIGDLFPLFYEALAQYRTGENGGTATPFIQIGKQLFTLEEIVFPSPIEVSWVGSTSLTALVEQARQWRPGKHASLTLEFASLTTFSRGSSKSSYGSHHAMLPLPQFVFQNLLRRWEDIASPELAPLIQKDAVEQYLQEDGVIITDYELNAHQVKFTTHLQRGFIGLCTYQLRGSNTPTPFSDDMALTLRQQLYLLAQLAFYTGIGYKTAMGLGQARLKDSHSW